MEQIYNYMKVAIRSIFKYRSDAILNVIGLSIGITISIMVLMYVRFELAYDSSYSKSKNTYRVITKGLVGTSSFKSAMSPMPLSEFLRYNFPEIENTTRIVRGANKLVEYKNRKYNEANFFYADSAFLSIFDVPIILGDPQTVLDDETDVLITTSTALRYFGNENPLGKKIKLDNGLTFKVSGVCKPQPSNSHFHFDFVASQKSIYNLYLGKNQEEVKEITNNWLRIDWYTYVVLNKNSNINTFETKLKKEISSIIQKQTINQSGKTKTSQGIKSISFHLQSLKDIHLHSQLDNELETNSRYLYVNLFLSLAIFVLIITCINFMNLTTARASIRIKEIGVRKLVGVSRKSLIIQFIVEAITYSFVALFIGLVLVELLLPSFNSLFGLKLRLNRIEGRFDLLYVILLTFLVGIVSGIFPALSFSKLKEAVIFKEGFQPQKRSNFVRGVLAALQMTVATFLIILCLGMIWQIQFLRNKNLGFNSHNIIVVERGYSVGKKFTEFKNRIKKISHVKEVSGCAVLPGEKASPTSFNYFDKNGEKVVLLPVNFVEKDFFKTLGIKFEAGSLWNGGNGNIESDVIINQKAKEFLKMNKPLGQRISFTGSKKHALGFSIKGVVKDFHFEPIQTPIRPLVLMDLPKGSYYDNLLIKISSEENLNQILTSVKKIWDEYTGNEPFEYQMLDDALSNNLIEEKLGLRILVVFMILSMLVAWLGLRAFAAYIDEMKSKEFMSKKVLGASWYQILTELFLSISHFILPGILLSIPLAYIVTSLWLNGFAVYSRLPLFLMLAVGGVVWGISFLLIFLHSNKSVKSTPVAN